MGSEDETAREFGVTKERLRQMTKQASRAMAELVAANPRFAMMAMFAERSASARKVAAKPLKEASAIPVGLLPTPRVRHDGLVKVAVVESGGVTPAVPASKRQTVPAVAVVRPAGIPAFRGMSQEASRA